MCLLGGGAGDESQINHTGLMDMSLSHHGDAFGDEGRGFDLLGKSVSFLLKDDFSGHSVQNIFDFTSNNFLLDSQIS